MKKYPIIGKLHRKWGKKLAKKITKLEPDHITITRTIIAIIAGTLITTGNWITATILINITLILDATDGELARIKNKADNGEKDAIADFITEEIIYWGLWKATGNIITIILITITGIRYAKNNILH